MAIAPVGTVAPGDTITSNTQNTMRDNVNVLDARTGGDPGASAGVLKRSSNTTGSWGLVTSNEIAAGLAVASLGYTPANKAGDTFTGDVDASGHEVIWGASGQRSEQSGTFNFEPAGSTFVDLFNPSGAPEAGAFSWSGWISRYSQNMAANYGVQFAQRLDAIAGTYIRAVFNNTPSSWAKLWHSENDGASSGLAAQTAATATTATTATTANAIADGAVSSAGKISDGIITLGKMHSSASDASAGTPSLRSLGTGANNAAAGNHTHGIISGSGTYTGNGGGARTITGSLGFQPRLVVVSWSAGAYMMNASGVWHGGSDSTPWGTFSGGSIDANGFTVPSGLNISPTAYTWSAFA